MKIPIHQHCIHIHQIHIHVNILTLKRSTACLNHVRHEKIYKISLKKVYRYRNAEIDVACLMRNIHFHMIFKYLNR